MGLEQDKLEFWREKIDLGVFNDAEFKFDGREMIFERIPQYPKMFLMIFFFNLIHVLLLLVEWIPFRILRLGLSRTGTNLFTLKDLKNTILRVTKQI